MGSDQLVVNIRKVHLGPRKLFENISSMELEHVYQYIYSCNLYQFLDVCFCMNLVYPRPYS